MHLLTNSSLHNLLSFPISYHLIVHKHPLKQHNYKTFHPHPNQDKFISSMVIKLNKLFISFQLNLELKGRLIFNSPASVIYSTTKLAWQQLNKNCNSATKKLQALNQKLEYYLHIKYYQYT